MKKTYRKNIWRTVRHTLSRFGAIFAIVALGVGFLAGLLATTPDMRNSGDVYFDDSRLFDVRVLSTMGLTADDVAALRKIDGVDEVMPGYYADMLMLVDATSDVLVTRIHSLPNSAGNADAQNYLNRVVLQEGRLPTAANECVVEQGSQYSGVSIAVGDTLTLTDDNKNPDDTFAVRQFTVTGIVTSSYYFSIEREPASVGNGSVGLVMYTPESSFDTDGIYTNVFLSLTDAHEMNSLSDEYEACVNAAIDRIEAISGARCEARLKEIKADANEVLGDAKQEYADAKAEADEKLADAAAELADGKKQLADGQTELADAKQQIEDGQAKLDSGRNEYSAKSADGYAALAQAETELANARAALANGQATYQTEKAKYDAGVQQIADGEAFIAQYEPLILSAEQFMAAIIPTAYPDAAAAEQALGGAVQQTGLAYQTAVQDIVQNTAAHIPPLSPDPNGLAAQVQYIGAQVALDAAMVQAGHTEEAAWLAAKPAEAQPYVDARNAAAAALSALDPTGALQTDADTAIAAERGSFLTAGGSYIRFKTMQALATLRPTLDDTKQQIAANKPLLSAAKAQLDAAAAQLASGQAQLAAGESQLQSGRAALESGLADAAAQLSTAAQTLADARSEYTKGLNELNSAKADLADGEQEYNDAKKEAEEKLADAAQKIADAEQEIADLETPEWYVLGRDTNVSFVSFKSNTQKVEAIARIFPVFFFLVAALVALTTMTRMVEEERLQIGTMKALGYRKGAIMAKYIFYAMAASVSGSIFGLLVGFRLFPTIIWNAYTMMYQLPKLYCPFHWSYALIASGAAILCTLAATLNACWATLQEAPAQLMLPRAPKAGKRIFLEYITPLWSRMKFTHKVTARNLLLYKKRFFMTVFGIAGCTALLVTGFGLHDSISDIVSKQFGEIFTYDFTVSVKDADALESEALLDILGDTGAVSDFMSVHQEKSSNTYEGTTFSTYLFVPEDSARLNEFVTLRNRKTGDTVPFSPQDGIVITEKMSERTGYGVGDSIALKNNSGATGTFLITGIAENYVENYVYLSKELYEQQYGTVPDFTTVFARFAQAEPAESLRDSVGERLLALDEVSSLSFISDLKDSFSNMMTKIDTIVVVLIVCAALLAFVVLYNLTNINITEREKEIATIKVLGFFDQEVSAYVYRESILLSLIGALVGLVLGIFLHAFVIYNVEVDAVMFGRTVKGMSYVYSFLLTIVFSLFVNLVMKRKLRRISMVESMKAPE